MKKRKHSARTYKDCFVASELSTFIPQPRFWPTAHHSSLVDILVTEEKLSSRSEAVEVARCALSLGHISHVTGSMDHSCHPSTQLKLIHTEMDFVDSPTQYYKFHDRFSSFRAAQDKLRSKIQKEMGKIKGSLSSNENCFEN